MHEAERYELGETSCFVLNLAQEQHLAHPVLRCFRVSVHHGRSGANSATMRGANYVDPLRGGEFVAGENLSNLIVEDLSGGAGQCVQAIVPQHREIAGKRHSCEFDSIGDFHGREGMDVHAWGCFFHGAQNVAIVKWRQAVRQAALDTDLSGADLGGLDGFLRDLVRLKKINVRVAWSTAKGTELASDEANVGEVDIAIDHVGDDVAAEFGAQQVGCR